MRKELLSLQHGRLDREMWGPAERAFLGRGLSLNPQLSSSADSHLDNQLIVE